MPDLDVTDLMTDPDLASQFRVIRSQETIDEHGRPQFTPRNYVTYGSVQPASGRTLQLLPDLANVSGSIEIYTRFRLQENDGTFAADQVVWQNKTYLIMTVVDWSAFGRGWVRAVGTLQNLVGPSSR